MKIVVQKTVGDLGETWMVEIPVDGGLRKSDDPVTAIKAKIDPVFRVMDDRLLEINMRLLNRNAVARKLGPEANMALHQTVEVMYGRRQGPVVIDRDGMIRDTSETEIPPSDPEVTRVNVDKAQKALGKLEAALEAGDAGA